MAGEGGFEPPIPVPKTGALPLGHSPKLVLWPGAARPSRESNCQPNAPPGGGRPTIVRHRSVVMVGGLRRESEGYRDRGPLQPVKQSLLRRFLRPQVLAKRRSGAGSEETGTIH